MGKMKGRFNNLKLATGWLLLICACFYLVGQPQQHLVAGQELSRRVATTSSSSSMASSAISAETPPATTDSQQTGGPLSTPDELPLEATRRPPATAGGQGARSPARRKPKPAAKARRPIQAEDEDEGQYEDGDDGGSNYYLRDDDRDYQGNFFQMSANPMRHFGRMMSSVFDQMQPNFEEFARSAAGRSGGNLASASSFSDGDGFSRMASSVSSNGRTRGIVSETRNGRTQTRRFGDDEEETNDNLDYSSQRRPSRKASRMYEDSYED